MTATPNAPPTWSATVLVADPIPESPWGTDPMTEFVAVGSMSPAPKPIRSRPKTTSPYVVSNREDAETCHSPAAMRHQAGRHRELVPHQAGGQRGHRGPDDHHDGDREDAQAGLERGVPEVELQELRLEEQRPHEPEHGQALGREGDREPAVAEEHELEHGVRAAGLPENEATEHHEADQSRPHHGPRSPPRVGPSMIAQSSSPSPAIDNTAPAGSGRCTCGFFESGTTSAAPRKPMHTIGTLTRKIDPHQNLESSSPPAMGPMAIPSPIVPPQTPMARRARRGSRKMSLMIASDVGIVSAAPTPMRARNAMSVVTEPDRAAPTDPNANTVSPMRKNRLRPKRSARVPPTRSRPAKTMA